MTGKATRNVRRAPAACSSGFTLVELLIVVAIIAILAAIAVPNLLEAQIRAKTSRAHDDLHASAIALEAYYLEAKQYPPYGNPWDVTLGERSVEAHLPLSLTTPVPYLGHLPPDPFGRSYEDRFRLPYRYVKRTEFYDREPDGQAEWEARLTMIYGSVVTKEWECFSIGPDNAANDGGFSYDPTNGTVSFGDIVLFGPQ